MNLELFHRQACPYSAKVRDAIHAAKLDREIPFFDIEKDESKKAILEEKTGDEQVPCLMVDGKPLLESDDIIAFLESHREEIAAH